MLIQVSCISIQVLLLLLDYAMGYSRESNETVGPPFFYWTFYAWVPQWGMVLSLLYLTRSGMRNSADADVDTSNRESSSRNTHSSKSMAFVDCDVSVTGEQTMSNHLQPSCRNTQHLKERITPIPIWTIHIAGLSKASQP